MTARRRVRSCVICGETVDPDYRPFCSRRCADVDLGHWLSGSYAVPSVAPLDVAEEEELDRMIRQLDEDAEDAWGEPS